MTGRSKGHKDHKPAIRQVLFNRSVPGLMSLIFTLILLYGCAYFNTFYNARTYYESGVEVVETGNSSRGTDIPKPASDAFGKAIEKSHKVIDKYPDSRYVEEAFYIIGRSHFYRREYGLAERYLQQLLREYPWSRYTTEIRIWLAKVHAQMGLPDAVDEDLVPILEMANPPRNYLHEIYVLRGDMALRDGDIDHAIRAFKEAAGSAIDNTQEAAIYRQLHALAMEIEDYKAALNFLDRYARTTPNEDERIHSRLSRVQLLQKMNDLDGAYKAIRNMVPLTEFASILPGLQLELGKIEYVRGNKEEALNRFVEVLEEHSAAPEASEAAFRCGEIYLTEFHDAAKAQDYYRRVKRNTTYDQPTQIKLKQIAALKELEKAIEKYRSQIGLVSTEVDHSEFTSLIDSTEALPTRRPVRDADKTPESREPDVVNDQGSEPVSTLDTSKVRQSLAYAMYRMGEIQLFEMQDEAKALEIMAEIVTLFEETEVAAQAAYVLYVHTQNQVDQTTFWRTILLEKYPDSPYGRLLSDNNSETGNPQLDLLMARANEELHHNPERSLRLFKEIWNQFGTEQSSYAIAYLYDEYLAQLDSAIIAYDDYLSLYPSGAFTKNVTKRLDFLRQLKVGVSSEPAVVNPPGGQEPQSSEDEEGAVTQDGVVPPDK